MSEDVKSHQKKLLALFQDNTTLALATLNKDGEPEASHAPYIYYEQAFWIFVSQLSSHTANLIQHKKTSVLICESQSSNIFASVRSTIQCNVEIEDNSKDKILDLMTEQLGETITMLRQLPDFYLLKLQPQNGRFIMGFGKAFDIHFPDMDLLHINPTK